MTTGNGRIERIELANDEWWELIVRPTWAELKQIAKKIDAASNKDEMERLDVMLVASTNAWSRKRKVTVAALQDIDGLDMLPVLKVVNKKILPLYAALADND
jgi:hypothetical protein